jgi:hypothetical protein
VAAPQNASVVVAATEKDSSNSSKNVDAAMDLIKALSHSTGSSEDASEEDSSPPADEEPAEEAPAPAAPKKPVEHAKLDFGFVAFEANLTEAVSESIRGVTTGAFWNGGLQGKLIDNVTTTMNAEIKSALSPLKQSISKTWMALKTDDQRDVFVNQLKSSFQPVFTDNLNIIMTHLKLGLRRVQKYGEADSKLSQADALQKSEVSLSETLLAEHCYEESRPRKDAQGAKKFCIPSSVTKFVGRLNDTEGLIGMSMRFEAGAMGFVQTGKNATAKNGTVAK